MLAAIAEFERELIRERTGEGRKRAIANGVRFGRKPNHQRKEALARRGNGETLAQIARTPGHYYAYKLPMDCQGQSIRA
jgi:DNA invertase Pin-like site-specific DNA recombinase